MPTSIRPIPLRQTTVTDAFWSRYQKVLRETTLQAEYEQLKSTGRVSNFWKAARKEQGEHEGLFFNDSDVYKWLEACAYALLIGPDTNISRMRNEVIDAIEAAQEEAGYLNTFFQLKHPNLKWRNLNTMHEMYCAGHLVEAGVADFECTGERRLLDIAIKNVEHIMSIFGPDKRRGYCGHQELELALLALSRTTDEKKYAEFARWMVEQRGVKPSIFEEELKDEEAMTLSPWALAQLMVNGEYQGDYAQDHAPIREQTEIVGHAVRAMYFYMAAAELLEEKDDESLRSALTRIWDNLINRRMYITGGIGPSAKNEGFTTDYDLPNLSAYAETCAAIGLVFWAQRMVGITGDSSYADVLERALYNGVLSGMSLSGDHFFYANPLESRGNHNRVPWFNCACCPPNIARLIGSVARYTAGVSDDGLWVHVPIGFRSDVEIGNGRVHVELESNYPWNGTYKLKVSPQKPTQFKLRLRIPSWCDEFGIELEGHDEQAEYENGYAVIDRLWQSGDELTVEMEMNPQWMEAHPKVLDNLGRVALTRGPLVYCLEQHDLGSEPQRFTADVQSEPVVQHEPKLLSGVTTIATEGWLDGDAFVEELYAPLGTSESSEATAKFIPYYVWCNRGPNHMQVWVRG